MSYNNSGYNNINRPPPASARNAGRDDEREPPAGSSIGHQWNPQGQQTPYQQPSQWQQPHGQQGYPQPQQYAQQYQAPPPSAAATGQQYAQLQGYAPPQQYAQQYQAPPPSAAATGQQYAQLQGYAQPQQYAQQYQAPPPSAAAPGQQLYRHTQPPQPNIRPLQSHAPQASYRPAPTRRTVMPSFTEADRVLGRADKYYAYELTVEEDRELAALENTLAIHKATYTAQKAVLEKEKKFLAEARAEHSKYCAGLEAQYKALQKEETEMMAAVEYNKHQALHTRSETEKKAFQKKADALTDEIKRKENESRAVQKKMRDAGDKSQEVKDYEKSVAQVDAATSTAEMVYKNGKADHDTFVSKISMREYRKQTNAMVEEEMSRLPPAPQPQSVAHPPLPPTRLNTSLTHGNEPSGLWGARPAPGPGRK